MDLVRGAWLVAMVELADAVVAADAVVGVVEVEVEDVVEAVVKREAENLAFQTQPNQTALILVGVPLMRLQQILSHY